MKTTARFENAIHKLYDAFNNDTLHPEYCHRCAVGNMLDNVDSWRHLTNRHGSLELNYVGIVNQKFGKRFGGYTPLELLNIEATFLKACGFALPIIPNSKRPENPTNKDLLFQGLAAVISYLCALDSIPNVMEYTQVFEAALPKRSVAVAV